VFLLTDFCSDRLAGNDDFHPPVLLSAGARVITGYWIVLTHSRGRHVFWLQALLHQKRAYSVRPLTGKREIEGLAACAVGVALNSQLQAGMRQDDAGEPG